MRLPPLAPGLSRLLSETGHLHKWAKRGSCERSH